VITTPPSLSKICFSPNQLLVQFLLWEFAWFFPMIPFSSGPPLWPPFPFSPVFTPNPDPWCPCFYLLPQKLIVINSLLRPDLGFFLSVLYLGGGKFPCFIPQIPFFWSLGWGSLSPPSSSVELPPLLLVLLPGSPPS